MILGLQIIAILFSLIMTYFTFLHYKRKEYDIRGFVIWLLIWIGFMILAIFPETVYGVMESLKIERTVDFFVISGFLIFSVILFRNYAIAKKNEKRIEQIVRKFAIEKDKK